MYQFTKCVAITVLLAVGLFQTRADDTNLVQDISIRLLGMKQGQAATNWGIVSTTADLAVVDTRQVITALGAAVRTTFSSTAKLVLVTSLTDGSHSLQVRDGINTFDVSSFFTYELVSGKLNNSLINLRTGRNLFSDTSIQRFVLTDTGMSPSIGFDVRGVTVSTTRTAPGVPPSYETTIEAAGAGDRNGNLLILQGLIRIEGNTLEIVAGGGGVS